MAKLKKDKQLLVEGNDDLHVLSALCVKHKVPDTFEIVDCKGITALLSSIPVRLKESGVNTIGILIDADTDIMNRWESVRQQLNKAGYTSVPTTISKEGYIHKENGKVTIGVWLMPDNNTNGMLEDFIRFLIPDRDALLPIAESTLDSIESESLNNYSSIHKSKALIHTWLAWQEVPGTPMGLGITKRYLDPDVKECSAFVGWIKSLFS